MKRKDDGTTWMDHDFHRADDNIEGLSGEQDVRRVDVRGDARKPGFLGAKLAKSPSKVLRILHTGDKPC